MVTNDNYRLLIQKLDQFIRKYYINQLIRGILYSVGLIVLLFLAIAVIEYYAYLAPAGRKALFFSFIGLSVLALGGWVFLPLARYFRLGKVISHEQAAEIIGSHFGNVKDKLLNVLHLKRQSDQLDDKDLILASIDQKSDEIRLVPFRSAINLSNNRKYLRYALPPLLLLLVLLFAAPSMIKDSTTRLINNNKEFERPAPFTFLLDESELEVVQYEDFLLEVEIAGEQLPNEVFIDVDNYQYRLTKQAPNLFSYRFNNVQKDLNFRLLSGTVNSGKYALRVLKKPIILGFEVKLDYPAYTGRKNETLNSVGDLVVPVGSRINWVFNAENTDAIELKFGSEADLVDAKRFSNDLFTYSKNARKDEVYKLFITNDQMPVADSISYALNVVPDLFPDITAQRFQDSLDNRLIFFVGEAGDDYGLKSVSFNYRIKRANGAQSELQTTLLAKPESKQVQFDHVFDLNELDLGPGEEVMYYFEAYDNDGVNGSKASRTSMMVFAMPTVEEFEAMAEANDEKVKDNLEKALEESRKIQEDMKRMREKLLQEKELDWQNRKEIENLLNRQKELQQQIEEANEAFQENLENQEEFMTPDQETLEKQQQLEKLMEELMSEEMREMMEKLEEMLQEMEKEDALKMMEEMELDDEELEKQMERMLELFKQMEIEQEMEKLANDLEELAKEQEELSEQTEQLEKEQAEEDKADEKEGQEEKEAEAGQKEKEEGAEKQEEGKQEEGQEQKEQSEQREDQQAGEKDQQAGEQEQKDSEPKTQEDLIKKQEEINEKFDKLQEKMDGIEKKNEELENQKNLQNEQNSMEDIQRDLNDSKQNLEKQNNQKASQYQKNAAQKMQQMSQQMNAGMQAGQMEQMQEDLESLRQLLENLVGLSFDQEDLVDAFEATEINTPRYVELVQDQFKLQDDFRMIEDSLQALSKRVFQIESFVTEKVTEIKSNMKQGLSDLEERRKFQAADHQQRTMKNVNDLALMLSETMNQMQQQMASMMSGSQMCSKPGSQNSQGEPKDKISQGQKSLNEQMKDAMKRMGQGQEGISAEEFAKMAARQAALRQALREQQKKRSEQGKGSKELQELIDQMNQNEIDLVNKRLTNQMLQRQQEIITRLLEHEEAERQQEFEDQRKSETARTRDRQMPPELEEYIKQRRAEIEMFKTVSPDLKPFYKGLVEEYFKTLKEKQSTSSGSN